MIAGTVPAFGVSPDENAIVVLGLDPDSTRYITYDMVRIRCTWLLMTNWTTPYPFINNHCINPDHIIRNVACGIRIQSQYNNCIFIRRNTE